MSRLRISELSEATDVSVATIKYYLREGLLPGGQKVGQRLAEYDESHARRLRLLRALREVGQVPVERLRSLVEAVDDEQRSLHEVFGVACDQLGLGPTGEGPDRSARMAADALISRAGWTEVRDDAPGRDELADVLATMFAHDLAGDPGASTPYLEAADRIARAEIAGVAAGGDPATTVERMVLGQVLGGRMLLTLRRLAEEHHSAVRFGDRS